MIRYFLTSVGVIFLLGVLISACAVDIEPDSASPLAQSHLHLGSPDDPFAISSVTQCGSSCPVGSHGVARFCTPACNGGFACTSSATINTITCETNTNTFTQCSSTCPTGWHATWRNCSSSCQNGIPCNSSTLNAAQCVQNSGSFQQCGTACPAGWSSTGSYCNSNCQNGLRCTSSSAPNATGCNPI